MAFTRKRAKGKGEVHKSVREEEKRRSRKWLKGGGGELFLKRKGSFGNLGEGKKTKVSAGYIQMRRFPRGGRQCRKSSADKKCTEEPRARIGENKGHQ